MSQKYSIPAVPKSPNWRTRAGRDGVSSPSRRGVNLSYRRQGSLVDETTGSSWFLPTPLAENNVYPPPSALISPNRPPHRSLGARTSTPFLTLAQAKLDKILPQFLLYLSKPTFESATKACALFDSSIVPQSSSNRSQNESPVDPAAYLPSGNDRNDHVVASSPTNSLLSAASVLATSPSSPLVLLKEWISSPGNSDHSTPHSSRQSSPCPASPSTPSAQAVEGEWDNLVAAPFWLLAAAEVLWADLYHLDDPDAVKGLFQRCSQDIFRLQRLMCDPILAAVDSSERKPRQSEVDAAQSVSSIFETLILLSSCRCQCLELQAELGESLPPIAAGMGIVLQGLENHEPIGPAKPLYNVHLRQLRAWKFSLEARLAVVQCLFLESIILMRQWKGQLPPVEGNEGGDETRHDLWLRQGFQKVLATLPLYFDRARAFAGPIYGLSANKTTEEMDSLVLDFLRRQVRLAGPPTAVAIVLDAAGASNFHPERGFRLSADEVAVDDSDIRTLWPAVYMRSTVHSINQGQQKPASVSSSVGSGLLSRPLSAASSFSSSPSPRRSGSRKTPIPDIEDSLRFRCTSLLLEYGSDEGVATSWPHSDWGIVSELLDRRLHNESNDDIIVDGIVKSRGISIASEEDVKADESSGGGLQGDIDAVEAATSNVPLYPIAVTYREAAEATIQEDLDMPFSESGVEGIVPGFFPKSFSRSVPIASSSLPLEEVVGSVKVDSTFHLVSLSKWATMVVFVKKEQSGRWQQRNQLSDVEIQKFLSEMAEKLRVASPFSTLSYLPPSKIPKKVNGEQILTKALDIFQSKHGKPPWSNDVNVKFLVSSVKDELGLRPVPEVALAARPWWQTHSTDQTRDGSRSRGLRINDGAREGTEPTPLASSAAALFLGSELSHLVAG